MLTLKELRFIEGEIKNWRDRVRTTHYNIFQNSVFSKFRDSDEEWMAEETVKNGLRNLYNHIIIYLEAKGLHEYLKVFNAATKDRVEKGTDLLDETTASEDYDPELKLLVEFERFLRPFSTFNYSEKKEEEFDRLLKILKETPHILEKTKLAPKTEADIYNTVKWVLGLYFSTCKLKGIRARFISVFKSYDPDILIPELNVAIEFKLVRENKVIEDYIDQIKIDQTAYKGDDEYETFIAVLCVVKHLATEAQIKAAWDAKRFPKNWHLVIAFIQL